MRLHLWLTITFLTGVAVLLHDLLLSLADHQHAMKTIR
jgi:hypothetical protein